MHKALSDKFFRKKGRAAEGKGGLEHIRVSVRVRGGLPADVPPETLCVVAPPAGSDSGTKVVVHGHRDVNHTFTFDNVFFPHPLAPAAASVGELPAALSSEHVFDTVCGPLVEKAMDGCNVCVLAYGQTGSGKTYTMVGGDSVTPPAPRGLIPRVAEKLLDRGKSSKANGSEVVDVHLSAAELYNESVSCLLTPQQTQREGSNKQSLRIRYDPVTGPYVEGLQSCRVEDAEGVQQLIDAATQRRKTAPTYCSERSSRSHIIFTFQFTKYTLKEVGKVTVTRSTIHMVDLAGSERVGQHADTAAAEQVKEGIAINQSLLSLGRIINQLADNSSSSSGGGGGGIDSGTTVGFRESALTFLLKNAFGGDAFTHMVATVDPRNLEESLSTLRYATKAACITTCAKQHQGTLTDTASTASKIAELTLEVKRLKEQLADERLTGSLPSRSVGGVAPALRCMCSGKNGDVAMPSAKAGWYVVQVAPPPASGRFAFCVTASNGPRRFVVAPGDGEDEQENDIVLLIGSKRTEVATISVDDETGCCFVQKAAATAEAEEGVLVAIDGEPLDEGEGEQAAEVTHGALLTVGPFVFRCLHGGEASAPGAAAAATIAEDETASALFFENEACAHQNQKKKKKKKHGDEVLKKWLASEVQERSVGATPSEVGHLLSNVLVVVQEKGDSNSATISDLRSQIPCCRGDTLSRLKEAAAFPPFCFPIDLDCGTCFTIIELVGEETKEKSQANVPVVTCCWLDERAATPAANIERITRVMCYHVDGEPDVDPRVETAVTLKDADAVSVVAYLLRGLNEGQRAASATIDQIVGASVEVPTTLPSSSIALVSHRQPFHQGGRRCVVCVREASNDPDGSSWRIVTEPLFAIEACARHFDTQHKLSAVCRLETADKEDVLADKFDIDDFRDRLKKKAGVGADVTEAALPAGPDPVRALEDDRAQLLEMLAIAQGAAKEAEMKRLSDRQQAEVEIRREKAIAVDLRDRLRRAQREKSAAVADCDEALIHLHGKSTSLSLVAEALDEAREQVGKWKSVAAEQKEDTRRWKEEASKLMMQVATLNECLGSSNAMATPQRGGSINAASPPRGGSLSPQNATTVQRLATAAAAATIPSSARGTSPKPPWRAGSASPTGVPLVSPLPKFQTCSYTLRSSSSSPTASSVLGRGRDRLRGGEAGESGVPTLADVMEVLDEYEQQLELKTRNLQQLSADYARARQRVSSLEVEMEAARTRAEIAEGEMQLFVEAAEGKETATAAAEGHKLEIERLREEKKALHAQLASLQHQKPTTAAARHQQQVVTTQQQQQWREKYKAEQEVAKRLQIRVAQLLRDRDEMMATHIPIPRSK